MADTEFKKQLDKWFNSIEGRKCLAGKTEGKYLKNRLWLAFIAGWNMANENLKKLIKECS